MPVPIRREISKKCCGFFGFAGAENFFPNSEEIFVRFGKVLR
jgi:hypothetical protein